MLAAIGMIAMLRGQTVQLLRDVHPGGSAASFSSMLGYLPGHREMLFGLDDGVHGTELWRTDGTTAGTTLFVEFTPGPAGTSFGGAVALNEWTWIVVAAASGDQLWRTDGTVAGTTQIASTTTLGVNSIDPPLATLGDRVLFNAGANLWITDGTAAGTVALASPNAWSIVPVDNFALINALPDEVWATDGTTTFPVVQNADVRRAEGRLLLTQRTYTGGSLSSSRLTILDRPGQPSIVMPGPLFWHQSLPNTVLLFATQSLFSSQLLSWDGSGPPQPLLNYAFGSLSAIRLGDRWMFGAFDAAFGEEPRVTDGTVAGTFTLDLNPGPAGSSPKFSGRVGDRLLLWITQPATGPEPWVSDLTPAGTMALPELIAGPGAAPPDPYANRGQRVGQRRLLLSAGGVPWLFDGTPTGTQSFGNYALQFLWSAAPLGNKWLFRADDGVHGMEIFALVADGTSTPQPGCEGREFEAGDPVLGQSLMLRAADLAPGDVGLLLLALPAAAPALLGDDCFLQFDPTLAASLGVIVPDAAGGWSQPLAVPNAAGLVGVAFACQPIFVDPTAPTGWAGGKAYWLVPGS